MQSFRKTLVIGDPYRGWTLVWDRLGLPSGDFTVKAGDGYEEKLATFYPARTANAGGHMRIVALPAGVPLGDASIVGADGSLLPITVTAVRPQPDAQISTRHTAQDVAAALAYGCRVILAPGLHVWDQAVELPDGADIVGYGARVVRTSNGDYGERVFSGGRNATVRGVTFESLWLTFHSNPIVTGLVCIGCVFRSGLLGYGHTECFFQDCTFEGCNVTIAPPGLYLRPRFLRNSPGNAFSLWGPCVGQFAMIDAEFDGTDRGPVFNTNNGPVTDNLLVGLSCRNLTRDDNGNEIVMAEGAHEYSRNLHIHTRVNNCDGHVFQMDAAAHDNGFFDTVQDGGGGFWLMGAGDRPQTGNVYDNFELRGGGITLGWRDNTGRTHGANTAKNVFRNGAILNYRPSRLNQGRHDPAYYARQAAILALQPKAGLLNTVENVDVVGVPPGGRAAENIALASVRCNGVELLDTVIDPEPHPAPVPEPAVTRTDER